MQLRQSLPRQWIESVARVLSGLGLTPNMVSLLGFGVSLGASALLALGYLAWGGVLVLLAGFADMLDGALARLTQRATPFGALLDSTLDRLSEAAVLFGLLLFYLPRGASQEVALVYLVVVGSVMVSYIRARAEGLGWECSVGILTRPERVVLLSLGLILGLVLPALWLLAVLSYVTAGQRLFYLWQKYRTSSLKSEAPAALKSRS